MKKFEFDLRQFKGEEDSEKVLAACEKEIVGVANALVSGNEGNRPGFYLLAMEYLTLMKNFHQCRS